MRILIAEDDVTSRMILTAVLKKWEYEVVVVADGLEAWAALQDANAPRLAILDWMMPDMDGVEICQRIRKIATNNPIYIIMLTALGRKEDIVKGLKAGANDYLTKPFDNNELHARIEVGRRVIELQASLIEQIAKLTDSHDHVKTLQGLLPICMYCHKIRTDDTQNLWQRIEQYIARHSDATFSHGICPECLKTHYPGLKEVPRIT